MALTALEVRSAKGRERPYKVSDSGGLFMLVQPSGQRYWRLAYRWGGKQQTMALGVYPDVTFSDARTKRDAVDLLIGVATTRQYRGDQQQVRYAAVTQNLYDPVTVDLSSLVVASRAVNRGNTVNDIGVYVMDVMSFGKSIDIVGGLLGVSYRTRASGADYTNHAITPTAALILHPTAATSLYASYIQGLESAGVAPDGTANVGETLGPARSRQWEIGARATILGATASLSWFDIARALAYTDATNVYVANGSANHRGIEGSILGAIGHRFDVALIGQYLDAIQKRTGSALLDGKRVLNAPRWSGSAFVQYRPPAWDRFAINAGAYYTGACLAS